MNVFFSNFFRALLLILFFQQTKNSQVIILNLSYYYISNFETPSLMSLYTFTYLGSPKMGIYTNIHSDKKQNLFSIYEIYYHLNDSEKHNYYNYSKSQTFQNVSCLKVKYIKSVYDTHAKENFYFNIYNNKTKSVKEIEIKELNFILGVDLLNNGKVYFLHIGFPMVNEETVSERFKFDFVIQLKQRKIIDGYDWFILFDNKFNKGEEVIKVEELSNLHPIMIIGTLPHYYDSDNFYASQLLKAYSGLYYWSINFKDVYLYIETSPGKKEKKSIYVEEVEIYLDNIMVYAPMNYINLVKTNFFSKYSACKTEKDPEFKIYCEKSNNFGLNELKKFPILYFDNVFLNYTFELTYKELFIEMNGIYYFLVTENSDDEAWSIGYSLLKKYQFVFNQDSRTVGFYNPNLPKDKEKDENPSDTDEKEEETDEKDEKDEKEKDDKEKEKEKENKENNVKESGLSIELVILIICVSGIIFIVIGIFLGKFIFKKLKGKKRINELEENFDYFGTQENTINE